MVFCVVCDSDEKYRDDFFQVLENTEASFLRARLPEILLFLRVIYLFNNFSYPSKIV